MDVAYGTGNISILSNTGGSHLKLISSKNPSQVGDKVIFASRVAPTFPVAMPTGTISFFDGTQSLGTGHSRPRQSETYCFHSERREAFYSSALQRRHDVCA